MIDPARQAVWQLFFSHRLVGVAMLLSEENLRFAGAVSDRACVIERGHIRFDGTFEELSARQDVTGQYLQV